MVSPHPHPQLERGTFGGRRTRKRTGMRLGGKGWGMGHRTLGPCSSLCSLGPTPATPPGPSRSQLRITGWMGTLSGLGDPSPLFHSVLITSEGPTPSSLLERELQGRDLSGSSSTHLWPLTVSGGRAGSQHRFERVSSLKCYLPLSGLVQ